MTMVNNGKSGELPRGGRYFVLMAYYGCGSHFHHWIDYNGVAFLTEFPTELLESGSGKGGVPKTAFLALIPHPARSSSVSRIPLFFLRKMH